MRTLVRPRSTWGDDVALRLLARLREQPELTLCLPTGATPRPVYARVAAGVEGGEASFDRARIFLLDEFGGLPADDPARCERMIATDLLDHVDVDPERVHLPDVDAPDLGAVCADYEAAIVAAGGIDLALLGLGTNGHVGMNEPGSSPESRTRVVDLAPSTRTSAAAYGATTTPMWGITMGIATLLEARALWLLVSGVRKRAVLARATEGPVSAQVPASLLRRHDDLLVLADDEAAAP